MINIAVLGYGVVGSGVVEVFYNNRESIQRRSGNKMDIKYILDIRSFEDSPYADKFTKSFDEIVNDPDVQVVVEVMGGLNPAFDYVKRCLIAGKSVVTSNKELVAVKGAELIKIAGEHNVNFLFEASVGGGIPIIRPITQCLAANDIIEIDGILNGTTNFILTKMIKEQMPFEDALEMAQRLGYAERNPAADIEGTDACRKVCILASLAFGKHVYPEQVYTEGITKITLTDVEYAESYDSVIKLIGRAVRLDNGKISTTVYPALIRKGSQLASVDDVYNAVLIRGDAIGDVVFYGRGAGKLPTASAVVADVIDCSKHIETRKIISWGEGDPSHVDSYKNDTVAMYVLVKAKDAESFKKEISSKFEDIEFLNRAGAADDEVAFVIGSMMEKLLDKYLERIAENAEIISKMRVLDI